jgi:hypothetical protein
VAFPDANIADRDGGATTNNTTTSHTVNLPSNIVAGDLLFIILNVTDQTGLSTPAGWTKDSQNAQFILYSKTASGSEGATETVTTTNGTASAHTTYRISGWSSFEWAFFNGPNNTTPDPPNVTPTWGAKDTLWLACFGESNGNRSVSTYPSSYTNGRNDRWHNPNGVALGSAIRSLNATSEDPGVFTLSANDLWDGFTIAVEPSVAGGGADDVEFVDGASGTSVTDTVQIAKADLTGLADGDVVVVALGAHVSDATGWALSGWTQADLKNTS